MKSRYLVLAVLLILCSTPLFAQATRTWVSGVGDDANPCSRTAPCKTFAGAISKTAASGEIDVLDPGGFGAVTITKSMTIDGTGVAGGILATPNAGVIVNAPGGTVKLRNLNIWGAGSGSIGVRILQANHVIIEGCNIRGWASRGLSVEPTSGTTKVTVIDTAIEHNAAHGVIVSSTPTNLPMHVVFDNVRVINNGGVGVQFNAGSKAIVRNSLFANNIADGVQATQGAQASGASSVDIDSTVIGDNNATGLNCFGGAAIVRIGRSTISGNNNGIAISAGCQILSYGNNHLAGNAGANTGFSGPVTGNPQ